MPLIANVGRSNFKTRLLFVIIYTALTLGALSMVYPFGLMISNSLTSSADYQDYRLVPQFLYNDYALYKKYIVDKGPFHFLGTEYAETWYGPRDIKIGSDNAAGKNQLARYWDKPDLELNCIIEDWKKFYINVCPIRFKSYLFVASSSHNYSVLDKKNIYREWLKNKYNTIENLNKAYDENADNFKQIGTPYEDPLRQRWLLPLDQKYKDWQAFKSEQSFENMSVNSIELAFQTFLKEKYPDLKELAKISNLEIDSHYDITFPMVWDAYKKSLKQASSSAVSPKDLRLLLPKDSLLEFVKRKCPVMYIKIDKSMANGFKKFLDKKYIHFSDVIKKEKESIPFTEKCPMDDKYSGVANDWIEFMEQEVPLSKISFDEPLFMYQKILAKKYTNIEALNKAYGANYKYFTEIRLPSPYVDTYALKKSKSRVFFKYLTGNYAEVFDLIFLHGDALINTIIYICLAILCSLTVNPLAAYALSRYRLKQTNIILLFLLATMAFPPSVGMIPGFLLLKDLGLLNTFYALVLPGIANGFAIFLLKGFFDSLPKELYEAAAIDGASELVIFWRLALPLTKPILAIIALGAFTGAYGAFMFAFLVCQDPKMWTLMVFLYEFQQTHPPYLIMASLIISAIPTLLVFIFCQKIILRGIVIPSFK